MSLTLRKCVHEEGESENGTPLRYVALQHLYSSTSPCKASTATRSSNVTTKKVKARKLLESFAHEEGIPDDSDMNPKKPPLLVYQRCRNRRAHHSPLFGSRELESGLVEKENDEVVEVEVVEATLDQIFHSDDMGRGGKRRKNASDYEPVNLSLGSCEPVKVYQHRLRQNLGRNKIDSGQKCSSVKDQQRPEAGSPNSMADSDCTKKWLELNIEDADPNALIGLDCKVYWPLDAKWYSGIVAGYTIETQHHHVKYTDGEEENLTLSKERIKFNLSGKEIQQLKLKRSSITTGGKESDYAEMLALAIGFDDCQEFALGDIIWAKVTGHAMWPAVITDEAQVKEKIPKPGDRSVPVQFFGTHDFAWINIKQAVSFLGGLLSSFHLKCRQTRFIQGLEEAKMYLNEQKLHPKMLKMQTDIESDEVESGGGESEGRSDSGENVSGDEGIQKSVSTCPFDIGTLRVLSLGRIVRDSEYFHDKRYIWPEGYTAIRKYTSTTDPGATTCYKMEVLRDPRSKSWPLFRITLDNGDQITGSTPSVCWKKIYKKIDKLQNNSHTFRLEADGNISLRKPGSYMFGFSMKKVFKLIQETYGCKTPLECQAFGYRPVRIDWKDIDKCSVCHMDEEYENNLFLQCDKCRMMVHARCYGETEPLDGKLWLCNLCRPGAPISPPPCCLCPVIGGAMKPTTDGHWAHLTCAMWIPETCLQDIQKMEPIDGLDRIHKDRWKLLCSICGVSYGACIQCSNNACRVAYHPLCARAAGLCVELEDEDKLHLISFDEDDDQCIRLLSFCKKHRQPSSDRSPVDDQILQTAQYCSHYTPPSNPSGCARGEPFDFVGRRGRKEPAALAAVSVKRLYVENRSHLVSGYRQNGSLSSTPGCNELVLMSFSSSIPKMETPRTETQVSFDSKAERYEFMRKTFKKRLAFGKSGIHGYGIFAKLPHRAGDMVIEYTGEIVRPPVADIREHCIYNSLVGAGTYMFRIDDERVIDATKAGSIAHLINHSCEPNCYSRTVTVHGDEHIIIFAKRNINQWEELTYDYRFASKAEQLACYCGFPRCRGVVNDLEAEEHLNKIHVPRSELREWIGN